MLVAAGNSGDAALVPQVRALLADASPLVRGAAIWALSRLAPDEVRAAARPALAAEDDEEVREEWLAALAERMETQA